MASKYVVDCFMVSEESSWIGIDPSFDRKQRVKLKLINTKTDPSNWKMIKHCVPQGLVLGPLLFNIYVTLKV
jgi:hypothetical protein